MKEVVIVDSGGANLASLRYALERLGAHVAVSADAQAIAAAERVVLPGVGAAARAMQRLSGAGLTEVLLRLGQPVLGVCLGMQLLCAHSAEGDTGCLGVLPYPVRELQSAPGRPVPHMGWNRLRRLRADALLEDIPDGEYVYFVHSYGAAVTPDTLAAADYGGAWSAVMRRGNFCGTQFHPERSGAAGARLLGNFLRL